MALVPLIFAVPGYFLLRHGLKQASGVLQAFTEGEAVRGTIHSIKKDRTQSMNDKHPWKLIYHFEIQGEVHEGELVSFSSAVSQRRPGQPVWVVYVKEAPSRSTIYPPFK